MKTASSAANISTVTSSVPVVASRNRLEPVQKTPPPAGKPTHTDSSCTYKHTIDTVHEEDVTEFSDTANNNSYTFKVEQNKQKIAEVDCDNERESDEEEIISVEISKVPDVENNQSSSMSTKINFDRKEPIPKLSPKLSIFVPPPPPEFNINRSESSESWNSFLSKLDKILDSRIGELV